MTPVVSAHNLDHNMNKFRLASRMIFNTFFHVENPYENDGWVLEERFCEIEEVLFQKLVTEPEGLMPVVYGDIQEEIAVRLRSGDRASIMINRDVKGGYWDYPIKEITQETELVFIMFFDWDSLEYRDNRYARVRIKRWPSHPEVTGKDGLIETQSISFVKIKQEDDLHPS
ncbi:hypothetical protein GTA51_20130 [Desulfovibrio aerotolerans]|uniref:Uncharacterized protein n=1 Tax=Solidesulfovibrio aerotolerans TaxID=295255 RepID=A0A7C9NME3_9BACT|nr:hypothetical protein [Solidesulfovibrio aerotolerans]MYL85396.1 hypothetical protein [Solidesulfovibrio aerotolerans]